MEAPCLTWNNDVEKWTSAQIKINLWRFDFTLHSFDDVMQEAKLLFWKVQNKYSEVTKPGHLFGLYKTALKRSFIDKSRAKVRKVPDEIISLDGIDVPLHANYGYASILINELPDELKIALDDLTSGRVRLTLDRPTSTRRKRENANMRLRRRLAITLVDPVGDLKRVLRYNS